MTKQKQIHVLADETLGGTLREYVEVDRKAEAGDFVKLNVSQSVLKVESADSHVLITEGKSFFFHDQCTVLDPTDIIHIESEDGKSERYKLVDRKAEVGERVIIVESHETLPIKEVGKIVVITETDADTYDGMFKEHDLTEYEGRDCAVYRFQYRVLEPVDSESSPQTTDDLIANLVARVSQTERDMLELIEIVQKDRRNILDKIDVVKDDIETWAQEHENAKRELDDKIEMVIDDIVTLDERSREAQTITLDVETFTKIIGGDRR